MLECPSNFQKRIQQNFLPSLKSKNLKFREDKTSFPNCIHSIAKDSHLVPSSKKQLSLEQSCHEILG